MSTGPESWLLAERSEPEGGEEVATKYYLAMLPADTPLKRLGELAHSRWAIEQFYEDSKGECGLGDYQGRRWEGFHRHMALVMLAYSFLMMQSTVSAQRPSKEGFPPPHEASDAAGHTQAGARVAAPGSRALVHRHRPHQTLPKTAKLTE